MNIPLKHPQLNESLVALGGEEVAAEWQFSIARTALTSVFDAALEEPQQIVRRDGKSVVMLSVEIIEDMAHRNSQRSQYEMIMDALPEQRFAEPVEPAEAAPIHRL